MIFFACWTSRHNQGFFDLFLEFTYDGEGEVACPKYLQDFYAFLDDVDDFSNEEASLLLAHTVVGKSIRRGWPYPYSKGDSL